MITELSSIIAMISVMIGVPLISIPRIEGLYLMFVGQIGWMANSYCNEEWILFTQSLFLLCVNIFGIKNWKKKKIGENNETNRKN